MSEITKPKIASNLDTNFLKLIAIVAMTFDHTGKILFPDIIALQIIGRIAFPIFAYCIVVGCLYTYDIKKYLLRLTVFAVISQPIYALADHPQFNDFIENFFVLNIFFTLIIGVLTIWSIQEKKWWLLAICLIVVSLYNFDYGANGILIMVVFYLLRDKPAVSAAVVGVLLMIPFVFGGDLTIFGASIDIQGFAVLSLPLIYFKTNINPKINKYFFYAFYPLHLLVLYLVQII